MVSLVVSIINSAVLFFGYILRSNLKKDEVVHKTRVEEIIELNRKIHDRLVEAEDDIRKNLFIAETTRKRLLLCSARIAKYDESIVDETYKFINGWTVALTMWSCSHNDGDLSKERYESFEISKKISKKIDFLYTHL